MHDVETASDFLKTLNNSHPSIDFTKEYEENGRLSCLVMEQINNEYPTGKVHKKSMDTGLLLNLVSHTTPTYLGHGRRHGLGNRSNQNQIKSL